jgi:hypothetical protein
LDWGRSSFISLSPKIAGSEKYAVVQQWGGTLALRPIQKTDRRHDLYLRPAQRPICVFAIFVFAATLRFMLYYSIA